MLGWRKYYPSWRRALLPAAALDLRDANRFCDVRGWHGNRFERFQAAKAAHLDLVPPSVGLANALVVDIGANVGDWSEAVLRAEPSARVIAVEPNEAAVAKLERRLGDHPRVRIDRRAVSAAPGILDFHVTGHTANASLLVPRPEMQTVYGGTNEWAVREVVQVVATTVDELTDGQPVAVLKIDVQGAEDDVIAGATDTLRRTSAVLLEVLFVSHYEGGSEFGDLHQTMRDTGFMLAGLSTPFATPQHPALWADACYLPASSMP